MDVIRPHQSPTQRGPEEWFTGTVYIGMDTPETVDPGSPVQWMGPEASAANKALVEGQHVVLERDVSETDQYGRLLRYVRDGGRDTGLAQIRKGYAHARYDSRDGYDWHPMQSTYRRTDANTRNLWVLR